MVDRIAEILAASRAMPLETAVLYVSHVRELEEACQRYPHSAGLFLRLGEVYSLGCNFSVYREQNHRQRAIRSLERARTIAAKPSEKYTAIQLLCYLYGDAEPEKARELAESMPEIYQTRTALCCYGAIGPERQALLDAYLRALLDTAECVFSLKVDAEEGRRLFGEVRSRYGNGV